MDKGEFLTVLRESLEGYIPANEVEDNMDFYRNYFNETDQSDKEIIEELGDPRLIARTIIDAYKASKGPMADFYTEQARNEYSKSNNSGNDSDRVGNFFFSMWNSKVKRTIFLVGLSLILIVLVAIIVIVVGAIVLYVLPILFIILLVKLVVDSFRNS